MAAGDLTTKEAVKEWLAPGGSALGAESDALIERLITAASKFVCNHVGRSSFEVTEYTDDYDSGGGDYLLLRHFPVVSVTSAAFANQTITQVATGNPPASGLRLEPALPGGGQQRLTIFGQRFPRGRGTVRVTYMAGYTETPYDVEQAVIELVGERFRTKERIGQISKSIGNGETVTFSVKSLNDWTRDALQSYKRVTPA